MIIEKARKEDLEAIVELEGRLQIDGIEAPWGDPDSIMKGLFFYYVVRDEDMIFRLNGNSLNVKSFQIPS